MARPLSVRSGWVGSVLMRAHHPPRSHRGLVLCGSGGIQSLGPWGSDPWLLKLVIGTICHLSGGKGTWACARDWVILAKYSRPNFNTQFGFWNQSWVGLFSMLDFHLSPRWEVESRRRERWGFQFSANMLEFTLVDKRAASLGWGMGPDCGLCLCNK